MLAGQPGTLGAVTVEVVVDTGGVRIFDRAVGDTEPPPEGPPELGVADTDPEPEHRSDEGVTVIVLTPEYVMATEDTELLQVVITELDALVVSLLRVGDETVKDEPEERVTEKLESLTTMESTAAPVPETFIVYPPTEMTASVVRVTSLAARTRDGIAQTTMVAIVKSLFMIIF